MLQAATGRSPVGQERRAHTVLPTMGLHLIRWITMSKTVQYASQDACTPACKQAFTESWSLKASLHGSLCKLCENLYCRLQGLHLFLGFRIPYERTATNFLHTSLDSVAANVLRRRQASRTAASPFCENLRKASLFCGSCRTDSEGLLPPCRAVGRPRPTAAAVVRAIVAV